MRNYDVMGEECHAINQYFIKIFDKAFEQGYDKGFDDAEAARVDVLQEERQTGYNAGYKDALEAKETIALGAKCDSLNDALERGRNEAWELASNIVYDKTDGKIHKLEIIFGSSDLATIFDKNTFCSAMNRVKIWKEKQKQDATEINVDTMWQDIPTEEMTLEQARAAVKELREFIVNKHVSVHAMSGEDVKKDIAVIAEYLVDKMNRK